MANTVVFSVGLVITKTLYRTTIAAMVLEVILSGLTGVFAWQTIRSNKNPVFIATDTYQDEHVTVTVDDY